jgi:hypothetical protein
MEAKEYTRETADGLLKKTSPNEVNLPNKDLILIRVLYQDRLEETFKACKDKVDYPKDTNFWFFGFRFIKELLRDLGEGTWKDLPTLGIAPFFGYSSKRGYIS